ncbi:MAG: hypothetical protein AAF267_22155, partial [Deinococcota bacterium]
FNLGGNMLRLITSRLLLLLLLALVACGQQQTPSADNTEEELVIAISDDGIQFLDGGTSKQLVGPTTRTYNVYVIAGNNSTNAFYTVQIRNDTTQPMYWSAVFGPANNTEFNLVGESNEGLLSGGPLAPGATDTMTLNVQCHRSPTNPGFYTSSTTTGLNIHSPVTGSFSATIIRECHFL